ncbi:MAG TPA: ABC transporter permease [Patescibacteria group bacterium]|nr:ABC transporter permease [Patescibacteria group bacterium]
MRILRKLLTEKTAILAFVLLWEVVTRLGLVNQIFIPPFSKVVAAMWFLIQNGYLVKHTLISLERALGGFLLAAVIAIPLGLLMGGWFRRIQLVLNPLFEIAAQANPFILFHIVILFLGIGELAKVSIIAWICIWPILFNTAAGVRNVDSVLLRAAQSFGLNRRQLFFKVILPASAPAIFTGLRVSAGYSFFLLIAAEMMGSSSGLGWLILYSQENYNIQWIFAGATMIAILGLTMDTILQIIERRTVVWENGATDALR